MFMSSRKYVYNFPFEVHSKEIFSCTKCKRSSANGAHSKPYRITSGFVGTNERKQKKNIVLPTNRNNNRHVHVCDTTTHAHPLGTCFLCTYVRCTSLCVSTNRRKNSVKIRRSRHIFQYCRRNSCGPVPPHAELFDF